MDKAYQGFMKSQLIWSGTAYGMTQFQLPRPSIDFSELSQVPTNRRLGHQAEFVFLQLLKSCPEYVVITHSLQLIHNKRTLGELDYIIQNVETKEVLHIELTYKFYIIEKAISDPINQIIGPNRKDTFVKKLNKTRDKQMPLLFSKPSRSVLTEIGLDIANIRQLVAFYAHIFVPYDDRIFEIDNLNEDCIAGYWVNRDQIGLDAFKRSSYYLPNKSEWLHVPHLERPWVSYSEIIDLVGPTLDQERSVMLWKMDKNQAGYEIERFFIC